MKKILPILLIALLLLAGLAVLFYPSFSNWYNEKFQLEAIVEYDETIAETSKQAIEGEMAAAKAYNENLTGKGITDPFIPGGAPELSDDYSSILDVHDGIMGTIIIPKIEVNLPIYHGTGEDVLRKGVGHMEMTAFPIGGVGNHSVLTGHTALPSAVLFTNLDKLELGDEFYVKVYDQMTAWEVDSIIVVEPTNTKPLIPMTGDDYVTLVTCTPYAVNSHRLLVRGTRVPFEASDVEELPEPSIIPKMRLHYDLYIALAALIVVITVFVSILVRRYRRRKNSRKKAFKGKGRPP